MSARDMLNEMHRISQAIKDDEAANPERTALIAVLREQIAWSLDAELAIRKLAEGLLAAGYGNIEDAKAAALREAALELMNVSEHDSRMPGIRFAVGFLAGQRRPE